jgi:hypothetical protein
MPRKTIKVGSHAPSIEELESRLAPSAQPLTSAEFLVNSSATGNQISPAVAVSPAGGEMVVFAHSETLGGYFDIRGREYDRFSASLGTLGIDG